MADCGAGVVLGQAVALLAWSTTQQHDRVDTSDGRAFWHDAGLAKVRDAWKAYWRQ